MRTRRNASPASIPNAPIDLTSLLDVIFILLFIVILAYSKASQDLRLKQEELEQAAASSSQENASQSIHSDLIDQYTAEIAAGTTDPNIYLKRGDEYLRIAQEENYYDAYDYANKDYIVAFNLGGDLSGRAENIVAIYEAKAEKAKDENDLESYEGYLRRAENLIPSAERRVILNQLFVENDLKPFINKKKIFEYYDAEGNLEDYYAIAKYDERGCGYEISTYDGNDNRVDTYNKFEFDQYGHCIRDAVFSVSQYNYLKFYEEHRMTYSDDGRLLETKIYDLNTCELLGTQVNDYDDLGRFSGYHLIDAITGQSNGYVVYLYNENDEFWATDTYDANGNLLYHDLAEDE